MVLYCHFINKDHQRMIVDPMFMIIQSLRSFLIAVTTTAVAPIAVILSKLYLVLPYLTGFDLINRPGVAGAVLQTAS